MGLEFIFHGYIVFIYFSFCSEELFVCEPTVFNDKCTPCHRCKYELAWPLPWRWTVQMQADVYLTEACCPLWCAGWTRLTMVKEVQRPAAPGQATSWATPGETPSSSIAFHPAQNSVSPSFLHSNYHNIYSGTVCFCALCQVFLSVVSLWVRLWLA